MIWHSGYAHNANAQAAALAEGLSGLPGFALLYPTEINMVHIELPVDVANCNLNVHLLGEFSTENAEIMDNFP